MKRIILAVLVVSVTLAAAAALAWEFRRVQLPYGTLSPSYTVTFKGSDSKPIPNTTFFIGARYAVPQDTTNQKLKAAPQTIYNFEVVKCVTDSNGSCTFLMNHKPGAAGLLDADVRTKLADPTKQPSADANREVVLLPPPDLLWGVNPSVNIILFKQYNASIPPPAQPSQ